MVAPASASRHGQPVIPARPTSASAAANRPRSNVESSAERLRLDHGAAFFGHHGCMAREPKPPVAAVIEFIDCINRGDVAGLGALMTPDHQLLVLDEPPLVGKEANVSAWHGYASSFPEYVIYPHQITERDGRVAVLGHTTGSHLGLPDNEEARLTVIWLAEARAGALSLWRILEDNPQNRREFGFPTGEQPDAL